MRVIRFLLTMLLLIASALPSSSAVSIVRIGLLRVAKPDSAKVTCANLTDDKGRPQRHTGEVTIRVRGQGVEIAGGIRSACFVAPGGSGFVTVKAAGSTGRFRGKVRFSARGGGLLIVNEVGLEDYVRGVVASEMRPDWPAEALKAQAVIARTLAVERLGVHKREGFDLCDTTHCQVYKGVSAETAASDAAVRATTGRILTYNTQPIQALYCSCCGGMTAASYASKALGATPYLKVKKDTLGGRYACADSPHFDWTYTVSAQRLAGALSAGNRLNDFRVLREDASGRAVYVLVKGDRSREVDGYLLWNTLCRQLGWGSIKSTRFRVSRTGTDYVFRGHGLGHGIGLCQWGARARAEAGWSCERILEFYYPGTRLRG